MSTSGLTRRFSEAWNVCREGTLLHFLVLCLSLAPEVYILHCREGSSFNNAVMAQMLMFTEKGCNYALSRTQKDIIRYHVRQVSLSVLLHSETSTISVTRITHPFSVASVIDTFPAVCRERKRLN